MKVKLTLLSKIRTKTGKYLYDAYLHLSDDKQYFLRVLSTKDYAFNTTDEFEVKSILVSNDKRITFLID